MYVPPYESLLRSLKATKATMDTATEVTVPTKLLKLLIKIAIAHCDFDEEDYLRLNRDVRDALRHGDIESGHAHFAGYGYFEGRKGGMSKVDEDWYLKRYPDVAAAVRNGHVQSASQHFHSIGGGEGRSPNARDEVNAAQWKQALGKT